MPETKKTAATPSTVATPDTGERYVLVNTIEKYLVKDDGELELEDSNVTTSKKLTLQNVKDMRRPLIAVLDAWNEADEA